MKGFLNASLLFILFLTLSCEKGKNIQQEENLFKIYWNNGKLYIDMPKPSKYQGDIDWKGVDKNNLVENVYNEIKNNSTSTFVEVILRQSYKEIDQYGNESLQYKVKSIGNLKVSEVQKYKDYNYFDRRYHIRYNLEAVAFDYSPILRVDEDIQLRGFTYD